MFIMFLAGMGTGMILSSLIIQINHKESKSINGVLCRVHGADHPAEPNCVVPRNKSAIAEKEV